MKYNDVHLSENLSELNELHIMEAAANFKRFGIVVEECTKALARLIDATEYFRETIRGELISWGMPVSWADFISYRLPKKIAWRFAEMIMKE